MTKSQIVAESGFKHKSPIPQAVAAGGFVFLSAVRGSDPATNQVPSDARRQAELLFDNARNVLQAAGGGLDDVVKIAVYMVDLQRDRPTFNEVWREQFHADPPARFAVQVQDIGGADDGSLYLADITAYIERASTQVAP